MDLFLILIIVAIVLAVIVKVAFWLFVGWFAVRAVSDYAQQMDSEMAQFQRQLQQAGAAGGSPQAISDLMGRWSQMNQLYGSMNSQDQFRYSETMASMKADAASVGLFLD
jgi:hypothetical protein